MKTDILIVGAGPVGLTLALYLQQAGVSYWLVDRLDAPVKTSRASVIHAHTLEMLDKVGVSEALINHGLKTYGLTFFEKTNPLFAIKVQQLPSRYPFALIIPQNETERLLTERLTALGGKVERACEVTAIKQDENGVIATINGESIEANYIVGCDGLHSIVRREAGINFPGGTSPLSFILADVTSDKPVDLSFIHGFLHPEGAVAIYPLPNGTYRVIAEKDDAPHAIDLNTLQNLVDTRAGKTALPINEIVWASRFRIHHHIVDKYREGCMFVMGDAAHVHSPVGGQGMNLGMVDALTFGELLKRGELDRYETLRRPAANEVLMMTAGLTKLGTIKNPALIFIRNHVMRFINRFGFIGEKIGLALSGIKRRKYTV